MPCAIHRCLHLFRLQFRQTVKQRFVLEHGAVAVYREHFLGHLSNGPAQLVQRPTGTRSGPLPRHG